MGHAGGDTGADGALRLIRVSDRTATILFPTAANKERVDTRRYQGCPGPLGSDEKQSLKFRTHGLSLRPGKNGVHTLYVVFHGKRESVEVFELDARLAPPALTWTGCVVAPEPIGLNAVVGLDLVVSHFVAWLGGVSGDRSTAARTRPRSTAR